MALTDIEKKRAVRNCKIIWAVLFASTIALVILLATLIPSFKYVSYNQYALKQHRFGEVDLKTVYTQGRYVIDPIYRMVYFPSTMQSVDILSTVFSNLGLEFDMHIIVYYQLPKENLGNIYHQFSLNYENRISNIVKTVVKDIATSYSVDDYVVNREIIQNNFSLEVHRQLRNSIGVDIPALYFRLLDIQFPPTVVSSSLVSAIELQNNQIKNFEQQVAIIVADTNNMIAQIHTQANLTLATAKIQANELITNSKSSADAIISSARGKGIESILQLLNITTPNLRNEFVKLVSILDGSEPKILSGNFNAFVNV
ncbi:hypothetical protein QJ856_gp1009 [Tupanvirus deep ocean]|uniref:Uncharacterized protein n=2 Tax=Tupanvirus TaxID=2094720 RepID=A0AC62A7U7_9VIRU|nr:hypothetical protein QJ856_gp1009 [Tupanvirus deep ocean]QKU33748.1 hypothetical protein [Tupanvirus deep ocean]